MKLTKLSQFMEMVYAEGSAPSRNTLRTQIREAQLPGGVQIGGHYYVDMDEFDRVTGLRDKLAARKAELARSPLLAGLL